MSWLARSDRATYARATWLFLRVLGFVYLAAFWSLGTQILGLVGHDGILPADSYLASARVLTGFNRIWLLPTLGWISTSDSALLTLCYGGAGLAALLIVGILPSLILPTLWLTYLSLSVLCQEFLSYQWDALLLEAGFLAVFLAPVTLRESARNPIDPPRIAIWLLLWLLFRLMAGSGAVKLASADPTWHNLTALLVHFETQPIPTPLGWYAHQLPAWLLRISTALVMAIEIGAPFLIAARRRLRLMAFVLLVGLQVIIALTGNYAFFNLLAAALCLLLLDDAALRWPFAGLTTPRLVGQAAPGRGAAGPRDVISSSTGRFRQAVLITVVVITVPVSAAAFLGALGITVPGTGIVSPLANAVAPFRSINAYGLFAVMTPTRPEIVLEGSEDGATWLEYEFPYKAGEVHRRPPWVAPHQPRLDWQMWFAALGEFDRERWFQHLCRRVLEGDVAVLRLLERDPFHGRAPRFLRAVLYRYRFTGRDAKRRDGAWWTRERLGEYSPVLSLNAVAHADLR